MGYDRGDSFPFDFEPNGNRFGSKSKGKLSQRPYPIQCERNWKYSFLSADLQIPYTLVVYESENARKYELIKNISKIRMNSMKICIK